MTTIAALGVSPVGLASYRYAHWYFLAALAVIVAGFWPSFLLFRQR